MKPAKRKSVASKTVKVKAWAVFVAGNVVPDETFPADWKRSLVAKFQHDHERDDFKIRKVTITYKV